MLKLSLVKLVNQQKSSVLCFQHSYFCNCVCVEKSCCEKPVGSKNPAGCQTILLWLLCGLCSKTQKKYFSTVSNIDAWLKKSYSNLWQTVGNHIMESFKFFSRTLSLTT